MTNLGQAGKQKKLELVYRVVQRYPNGLGEREIAEELSIDVLPVNRIAAVELSIPASIRLIAWQCEWVSGALHLNEHQASRWMPLTSTSRPLPWKADH